MPDDVAVAPEVQDTPSAPASAMPELTPPPSTFAKTKAEPSAPAAAAPAETPEAPPDDTDTPTIDLADDTLDAVIDLSEEKIVARPKVQETIERRAQSIADQRIAEMQMAPQNDDTFQRYQQQYQGAAQHRDQTIAAVAPLLQRAANGEDVDPRQIAGAVADIVRASQSAEQMIGAASGQAARVVVNGLLNQHFGDMAGTVIAKTRDGRDVTVDEAYTNAQRQYDSMLANGDPRAMQMFMDRSLQIARSVGVLEGQKYAEGNISKKSAAEAKIAQDAAIQEQAALIAAKRAGQTPPAPRGTPRAKPESIGATLRAAGGNREADAAAIRAAGWRI